MDPISALALVLLGGYQLARCYRPPLPPLAVPPVAPRRPDRAALPLFAPHRGALLSTQPAVQAFLLANPGPLFDLAGVLWPARKYLNKLTYITGKPGTGKTSMLRLCMLSCAQLFALYEHMRWFVIDPTDAYLPFLYQALPEDISILRVSPQDQCGRRWKVGADVTDEATNEGFHAALFPESSAKNADPFWTHKGREVSTALVRVFHDRGADWELHDLVIPFQYPPFLKPFLQQSPRTRGMVQHELVGRLGRDIVATASATMNRLAIAAALWRKAPESFSLSEFLNRREVLHFSYTPDLMASLSGVGNALTAVLVLLGLKRNDEFNHTLCWFDEAKFLSAMASAVADLAARGRGAGFGAFVCTQAEAGLTAGWGAERVREFTELVSTWVTFAVGYETATAFSRTVGQIEGIEHSYSFSRTNSDSTTNSDSAGGSHSRQGGSSSWNRSHAQTTTSSSTASNSFRLALKEAVLVSELTNLPLADPIRDRLVGYCFNADTGCYSFATPFCQPLDDLPPPPFQTMPRRPASAQVLQPWTLDDLRRLRCELTPEFMTALQVTWGANGGVP
jgi:hypothetical protein